MEILIRERNYKLKIKKFNLYIKKIKLLPQLGRLLRDHDAPTTLQRLTQDHGNLHNPLEFAVASTSSQRLPRDRSGQWYWYRCRCQTTSGITNSARTTRPSTKFNFLVKINKYKCESNELDHYDKVRLIFPKKLIVS